MTCRWCRAPASISGAGPAVLVAEFSRTEDVYIRCESFAPLKRRTYTGKKKRSVEAPALRLPSKRGGEGPDFLPITLSTVEAFRAMSSKGSREL